MSCVPFILVLFAVFSSSLACKGCLNLDEYNFEKILSKFDHVLVKFDVAYPYGKEHDTFQELATDLVKNDKIILAQVGVKDYGEKDNEKLAAKYGMKNKESFPSLRLFVKDKDPVKFPTKEKWSVDNIKKFIKTNSNVYIGLAGCLEEFDLVAQKFVKSNDKKNVLNSAKTLLEDTKNENDRGIGEKYITYMKKIIDVGQEFVDDETVRLKKLLKDGKMGKGKKTDLSNKLNILATFKAAFANNSKTEL